MAVGPREVGLQFLAVSSGAGHRLQGRSPWGRVFCSPPPPLWSEGVPPAGFGEHFRAHDSSENIGSRVTSFVLRGKRSLTNFLLLLLALLLELPGSASPGCGQEVPTLRGRGAALAGSSSESNYVLRRVIDSPPVH